MQNDPPPDTDAPALPDDWLNPAFHRRCAVVAQTSADELGSVAHRIAAHALEAHLAQRPDASADAVCDVATGYFMKGDLESAARWYGLTLRLDPQRAVAYQNLSAIHTALGQPELAVACRNRAYKLQRVFVESASDLLPSILILCVGKATGNVPIESLMPTNVCTRIKYALDYADLEEDALLPKYELVFNAIGEPEIAAPLLRRLEQFMAGSAKPVLNLPAAVMRTYRHQLPGLLASVPDAQTAACVRLEDRPASAAALEQTLSKANIEFPVLLRPAATHGGDGLVRCDSLGTLWQALNSAAAEATDAADATEAADAPTAATSLLPEAVSAHYISAFRDYGSSDGLYRKYRIIFVDREPFPYHLAISSRWMVHYFSAEMAQDPALLAEERRFLENPAAALGRSAFAAIKAIGLALDLDYGGVDFTMLPDGQVFVFEANATMLIHREPEQGPSAYKNRHVQAAVDAFGRLLAKRSAA
jgi:tetratricopeptide (TPR) repeat protein